MGLIQFIENNTEDYIKAEDITRNIFITTDGGFRLVPYTIASQYKNIDDRRVVAYAEELSNRDVVNCLKERMDVLDARAIREIENNIAMYREGNNIPSFGIGMFKAALISKAKEKERNNRKG